MEISILHNSKRDLCYAIKRMFAQVIVVKNTLDRELKMAAMLKNNLRKINSLFLKPVGLSIEILNFSYTKGIASLGETKLISKT